MSIGERYSTKAFDRWASFYFTFGSDMPESLPRAEVLRVAADAYYAGAHAQRMKGDPIKMEPLTTPSATVPTYGIWIDENATLANSRALRGDEPDIIVRTTAEGHTTGSDARVITEQLFPGRSVFREIVQRFRAVGV